MVQKVYDRGIRRRLPPMLNNDERRLKLTYSLMLTLPGTPVLRYGEEIGMGDDLSLKERNSTRTPMQWSTENNGGFSTASPEKLVRPVIITGEYGYKQLNVVAQRRDPMSLLNWMERAIRTLQKAAMLEAAMLKEPTLKNVGLKLGRRISCCTLLEIHFYYFGGL